MTIWKCVDLATVFILLHPRKLNAFKAQIFFKAIFNWRLHHHHHPYFPHFPSQSTQQPIVTRQQTNQPSGETTPASRRRKLSLSRPLTARNVKVVGKKTKRNQTTNWRRAWSSVNRRALEVGRQYQLSRWGYPFNRVTPTPHRILFQAREGREFRYAYCAICSSCVCVCVCVLAWCRAQLTGPVNPSFGGVISSGAKVKVVKRPSSVVQVLIQHLHTRRLLPKRFTAPTQTPIHNLHSIWTSFSDLANSCFQTKVKGLKLDGR